MSEAFFWKNELTKFFLGICQRILHSISSILTYYGPQTGQGILGILHLISSIFDKLWVWHSEKLYPFEVKKKIHKKQFRRYEWRDLSRGQYFVIYNEFTRYCHLFNSPTTLTSSLKKTDSLKKVLKQPPKINF